jgi:hypothetical protein
MGEDRVSASDWHLARGGKTYGPISESKLFRLAEQGKLQPDDMLWKRGFETWRAASSIPGLLSPPVIPGKQDVPPRPRRSHVWQIGLGAGVAAGAVAAGLYWILVSWVQVPDPDQKALLESLTRLSTASAQGVNFRSFSELLLDATTKYKIAQPRLEPSTSTLVSKAGRERGNANLGRDYTEEFNVPTFL